MLVARARNRMFQVCQTCVTVPHDPSSDAQSPPVAHSNQWREAVRLIFWCVTCLIAPLIIIRGGPPVPGDEKAPLQKQRRGVADTIDVAAVIKELREQQPEYIGIGNSMMFTRLGMTPEAISALTGRKFYFIYKGGSDAPVWFLLLKNVVAASGIHPKAVFLFVRDNELTAPFTGKTGDAAYLKAVNGENDPVLEKFMGNVPAGSAGEKSAGQWLGGLYAFSGWREEMTRRVTDVAMDLGGGGAAKKAQRFVLTARFGLDHLRGDVPSDLSKTDETGLTVGSYAEGAEASLLPGMMRVAREAGTRLLVFRVKRRPDAVTNLPEEPAAMRDYARFLDGWLKERNGLFFDETYDVSIRLTDYLDGDHIRPERRDWYRGYFWERMKGVLP